MLIYYENLYVGFRENQTPSTEKNPLAFMTPISNDAAYKKRKSTVDSWCRAEGTNVEFPNTPLMGFRLGNDVERYSTSNKLFEIIDPRGFMLQLSSGNTADLLATCTIIKGVIQDPCVWCRNSNENWLVVVDDEIQKLMDVVTSGAKQVLKIGDIFETSQQSPRIYAGEFFADLINQDFLYKNNTGLYNLKKNPRGRYYGNYEPSLCVFSLKSDKIHIFYHIKSDGEPRFSFQKTLPAKFKVTGHVDKIVEEIKPGFTFDAWSGNTRRVIIKENKKDTRDDLTSTEINEWREGTGYQNMNYAINKADGTQEIVLFSDNNNI